MVRLANTQTLQTEACDVIGGIRAFWQELYRKRPVDVPNFQAVLSRHVPEVSEWAWAQVQQYRIQQPAVHPCYGRWKGHGPLTRVGTLCQGPSAAHTVAPDPIPPGNP